MDKYIYTLHVQEYPIHSVSLIAPSVVAKPFNKMTIVTALRLAMHHEQKTRIEVFLSLKSIVDEVSGVTMFDVGIFEKVGK